MKKKRPAARKSGSSQMGLRQDGRQSRSAGIETDIGSDWGQNSGFLWGVPGVGQDAKTWDNTLSPAGTASQHSRCLVLFDSGQWAQSSLIL